MTVCRLHLELPGPYFAEIPYYLWGQANYDSDGDCKRPTDRDWTSLYLQHRGTSEIVELGSEGSDLEIEAGDETASRLSKFLMERCGAKRDGGVEPDVGNWDHHRACHRAARVAAEFEQSVLAPFDSHYFWGSWKWIGWFATEFTWVGRWIMHSVVRNDPRAIPLSIDWLKGPPRFPEQEAALSYAIERLSGQPARTAKDWIKWYDGGWFAQGAKSQFPEPDINSWLAEMKEQFGDN